MPSECDSKESPSNASIVEGLGLSFNLMRYCNASICCVPGREDCLMSKEDWYEGEWAVYSPVPITSYQLRGTVRCKLSVLLYSANGLSRTPENSTELSVNHPPKNANEDPTYKWCKGNDDRESKDVLQRSPWGRAEDNWALYCFDANGCLPSKEVRGTDLPILWRLQGRVGVSVRR